MAKGMQVSTMNEVHSNLRRLFTQIEKELSKPNPNNGVMSSIDAQITKEILIVNHQITELARINLQLSEIIRVLARRKTAMTVPSEKRPRNKPSAA